MTGFDVAPTDAPYASAEQAEGAPTAREVINSVLEAFPPQPVPSGMTPGLKVEPFLEHPEAQWKLMLLGIAVAADRMSGPETVLVGLRPE
jgi:hypothetical protein